ncbi:MAG TPA: histidine phosphatase family protein [Gaiellales bacterium]
MPVADLARLAEAELVLLRHGETDYNVERRVNGDPSKPVALSARGREQARALAPAIGAIAWASAWHTRFPRTAETLALVLPSGLPVPQVVKELDDIDVGDLEGETIEQWRAWRKGRGLEAAPPGGESRIDVLRRYARGFERLADAAVPAIVVCHDQAIRYLENTLIGEDPLFGPVQAIPNATPYAYRSADMALGAQRLVERATR